MTQSTTAGPVPIETLATQIEQRFSGLELEIPKALVGTTVTSYSTAGANYSLRIDDFPVDQDNQARLDVTLAITGSNADAYAGTFGGSMHLGGLKLDLHFADESASLVACARAGAAATLDTGALMSALGLPAALAAPLGLGAEAEVIALFKRADAGTQTAYQKLVKVSLFAGEDLTHDLPLIGRALPVLQRLTAREISLFAASKHFNDDEMEDFKDLLPDGFSLPTEPPDDNAYNTVEKEQPAPKNVVLPKGLDVYLTLGCGPDAVSYVYQLGGRVEGNTFWFPVKKQAGPLYLAELGLQVDGDGLGLRLLASLTAGQLTLSLIGFGFKTQWSPLSLTLEPPYGAGLVLKDGPVEIGGALEILPKDARPTDVDFELLGDLVIKDSKISIGAMGSYAKLADADPSLFVFIDMFVPPEDPVIALTGVMGGFGYNSNILIPDQLTAISSWPFLKWLKEQQMDKQKPSAKADGVQALPRPTVLHAAPEPEPVPPPPAPEPEPVPPAPPPPAKPSPVLPSTSPLTVLQMLQASEPPWVTPQEGNEWLALGLQLTIVELVRCTGLLTVEFGNDLIISYMGMGTARYPQSGPEEFAYLELETEILFKPEDGYVSYMGLLSPNSFILDKECTLSGGFALCLWYGPSPHAGDFVFSAGGYHPLFAKPPQYPAVPRGMFTWHVGGGVTITGNCYAALVPRAIMAGGELDLLFHAGPVRAWFKAHADFLIEWKPFYYAASIGIDLGASLHVHIWFIHFTIKIELGADLDIWGPETGGKVRFHILFVSVTIHFGSRSGNSLPPATWAEFVDLLHSQPFNIQAQAGLLKAPPTAVDDQGRAQRSTWVLRPSGARIVVTTGVPSTAINGAATGLDALDIRPMQLTGAASPLAIDLEINDDENGWTPVKLAQDGWTCSVVEKSVPTALWGTPVTKSAELLGGPSQLTVAVGLTLTAPDAKISAHAEQADLANYSYAFLDSCALPLTPGASAAGPAAQVGNAVASIAETLQANAAARQAVLDDLSRLGLDPGSNDDMSTFVDDIGTRFTGEPMLC